VVKKKFWRHIMSTSGRNGRKGYFHILEMWILIWKQSAQPSLKLETLKSIIRITFSYKNGYNIT
jgi:uncharacterized membrane protein YhaH (DUF805 family)